MSKPRPGGGECSEGCGATHSSNWYGMKDTKRCRACYGKANHRKEGQQASCRGGASPILSSVSHPEMISPSAGHALESWQDLQAEVKTLLRILGCR